MFRPMFLCIVRWKHYVTPLSLIIVSTSDGNRILPTHVAFSWKQLPLSFMM
jgi:hypothetical protein